MALTSEEQRELDQLELEELEAAEAADQGGSRQNYAPTVEEMDQARSEVAPTTGEAIAGGFVEGVPFLKDAVSAFDGIADAMDDSDMTFEDAYGNYKENLDEINTDLTQAERHSPGAFMVGEIGGTAASLVAGGAALKATGAGATLTQLGMNTLTGAGVGAAAGLSRSRDRGVSDAVVGGTLGAAGEVLGHHTLKAIKKGGKYLLDKADDVGSKAVKKLLGIENVSSQKSFFKHLKRTKQKESEFLTDVLTQEMDDGTTVVDFGDTPKRMLDKIQNKKGVIGEEIGDFYRHVDAGHEVKIDPLDLKTSLETDVVPMFTLSDDPGMQEIGKDLSKFIGNIGQKMKTTKYETDADGIVDLSKKVVEYVDDPTPWTLTRTHKLQKDIRKRIETIYRKNGMDLSASKEQQRKVARALGENMDGVLGKLSTESDDLLGKIRLKRKQFGNLSTISESVEAEMYRAKDDPVSMIKDALGMKSLFISGVATSSMGPAGLIAGPVVNKIIQSPKTPLYLAKGLNIIGQVMSAAPMGEVAAKLNSAALMNNKKFKTTLYGIVGDLNLIQSPLARDAQSVQARQTDIRHVIKDLHPTLLSDFEAAMESGDETTIGMFMSSMMKFPGASKYFEAGIGFGGKVYDPEDKATLERQLKLTDLPAAQRIQMLNALRSNGIIPDLNSVVKPEPKVHTPVKKKNHRY